MQIIRGQSVFGGIAFGKVYLYKKKRKPADRRSVENAEAEINRFEAAKKQAVEQLGVLYKKAVEEVGEQEAAVFEIHQMMLEDDDYVESVCDIITRQRVNAEYAAAVAADKFARVFAEMDNPYMRERAADVGDAAERLLNALTSDVSFAVDMDGPRIVAADDLTPSETVRLGKEKILAFVTAGGSANSHTAIFARAMGIPAVIGVGDSLGQDVDGMTAIVDGFLGIVYLDPDEETTASMRARADQEKERGKLLAQFKGRPTLTRGGKEIMLYANIGSPSDAAAVLENDAEGVGLYRSEFLYLQRDDCPSEDELFSAYKTVAEMLAGKRMIIRTLDIGADKQAKYFNLPEEENPALGMRAIRLCLTRPEVFHTQLRAIYRASAYGKIAIMLPMIASVWEVRKAKEFAAKARRELTQEGIPFDGNLEWGIMIETPAAAIISDLLACEVDFFSIGTNDLTQYVLAVDRQNQSLAPFCDTRHEAVLRMIETVVNAGHKAGIWVGICGELASELSLTQTLLSMGVDELSVSPPFILALRKQILESDPASAARNGQCKDAHL
jgi:phosphotransferase system enzyme I (PtsI)